ncbi:MAG: hypothetical protein ACX939_02035, partial [Hyphococcus sp.]
MLAVLFRATLSALVFFASVFFAVGGVSAAQNEWDIDQVYPDDAAWAAERDRVESLLMEVKDYESRQIRGAAELADLLLLVSDARGRAGKMAKVGALQAYVDIESSWAEARYDEGRLLESRVEEAVAFVEPVVRGLGEARVRRWLARNARLQTQERRINRIFRLAPYAAKEGTEDIESQLARFARSSTQLYTMLLESDLDWPQIESNGETSTITSSSFSGFRGSLDVDTRRLAQEKYLSHLKGYEDLFAKAIVGRLEGDLAVAQLRGLSDSIDSLFVLNDGLEPGAYRAMLPVMREARPVILRAAEALRRSYGLDEMTLDDFLITSWPGDRSDAFSLDNTKAHILSAMAPFGADYQELLDDR